VQNAADDTVHTYYVDALQVEEKGYATTYCDGSLGVGYSWSGTAHASTSTRLDSYLDLSNYCVLDGLVVSLDN
jgi:hypothetical protein